MTQLEIVFMILYILCLISVLLTLTCLAFLLKYQVNIRSVKQHAIKSKSKHKKNKKQLARLKRQRKNTLVKFVISCVISLVLGGLAFYTSYYQGIHLTQEDQQNVVNGYYLLTDLENQLKKIEKGDLDEKKTIENIQTLGNKMASYSGVVASSSSKAEGQAILNRYYNSVKEIGINTSGQVTGFFNNPELIAEYLKDVDKAQSYQKEVFSYYKVNENELKKNK